MGSWERWFRLLGRLGHQGGRHGRSQLHQRFFRPADTVEAAVQDCYDKIAIDPAHGTEIAGLLDSGFDEAVRAHQHKTQAQKQLLAQLDRERGKLLQLFYDDALDGDQFKAEQARIRKERGAATKQLNSITNTAS